MDISYIIIHNRLTNPSSYCNLKLLNDCVNYKKLKIEKP